MLSTIDQLTTVVSNMPLPYLNKIEPAAFNLYFHLVLKIEGEILDDEAEFRLKKYIACLVRATGESIKAVSFAQERVHLLVGLSQNRGLADFVRELKLITKTFVRRSLGIENFEWQEKYEAFTVSLSQIERICGYIRRQKWLEKQESYASSWQPISSSHLY